MGELPGPEVFQVGLLEIRFPILQASHASKSFTKLRAFLRQIA